MDASQYAGSFGVYAFFIWLCEKKSEGLQVDRYFEDNTIFAKEFLSSYELVGSDARIFSSFGISPEDWQEQTLKGLKGMDRSFVQQQCSRINGKMKQVLPADTVNRVKITSEPDEGGYIYKLAFFDSNVTVEYL